MYLACILALSCVVQLSAMEKPQHEPVMSRSKHARQQHRKYTLGCGFATGFLANTLPQTTHGTRLANIGAVATTALWYVASCIALRRGYYPEFTLEDEPFLFQQTQLMVKPKARLVDPMKGYVWGAISGQIAKRLVPYLWTAAKAYINT